MRNQVKLRFELLESRLVLSASSVFAGSYPTSLDHEQAVEQTITIKEIDALTQVRSFSQEEGDFDSDGDVDGADFLSWQRGVGSTYTASHLSDWQTNFGEEFTGGNIYYVATNGNNSSGGTKATPWETIDYGMEQLVAGDTLIIRGGTYRERFLGHLPNDLVTGTAYKPITIKGYQGEEVIVNGMFDGSNINDWELVAGTTEIYRLKNALVTTYENVSQNRIPLKLMVSFNDFAGDSSDLTGPGQWSRNKNDGEIWVWAEGGGNPGNYNTEYTYATRVFAVGREVDYITFENLTVEGAYYAFYVEGDHITIKNSVVRNTFGDGIKVAGATGSDISNGNLWNSSYGLIENSDVYHFGESGIDITGGDYWTVSSTTIHDNVKNRWPNLPSGSKGNGIMLKNNNVGTVIDGNRLYNLEVLFGAIIIGGDTNYDDANFPPAVDIVAKNNIIHDVRGSYIIGFLGSDSSKFVNNILYNNTIADMGAFGQPYSLIQMRNGVSAGGTVHPSVDNTIANNIFYNNSFDNTPSEYNYRENTNDSDGGLILDNNIVDSTRSSYFDGAAITHANMVASKGYDANSQVSTPIFVDVANELIRLSDISVGIDAGMALADVGKDYNGVDRPLGNALDIGPFENALNTSASLIGEWKLNESYGTYVEDTSGKERHAQLQNMLVTDPQDTAWVIGEKTKALRFGAGQGHENVEIPNLSQPGLFDIGFTIASLVQFDNLVDLNAGIAAGLTGDASGFAGFFQQGDQVEIAIRVDGALFLARSDVNLWEAGEWVHLAATVDMNAKQMAIYVNGSEVTLNGVQSFTGNAIDTGTAAMRIGAGNLSIQQFFGSIDDVKLYNRPLSAEEIMLMASVSPGGSSLASVGDSSEFLLKVDISSFAGSEAYSINGPSHSILPAIQGKITEPVQLESPYHDRKDQFATIASSHDRAIEYLYLGLSENQLSDPLNAHDRELEEEDYFNHLVQAEYFPTVTRLIK